jgi:Trk K+ transport system NAD-binding subunit/Kef-type K+ transport system membrane component KefB/mannitol/fructose-specific phosphotransferase system IIA component (Ntr-type)
MTDSVLLYIIFFASFAIVALASRLVGDFFARRKLPLITGFLFTGIAAGPYVLNIIPTTAIGNLRFVDELSLAFIAFAAGSELVVRQIKSHYKAIRHTTFGLVLSTFSLGSLAFFLLSEFIPFTKTMPPVHRAAVSLLAGAILVARSPSSAIAVVNELRAKGPFTKTALGVTVIMDVVVITLFSICASIAGPLLAGQAFDYTFVLFLAFELILSLTLGYLLSKAMRFILSWHCHRSIKTVVILSSGLGIFVLSGAVRHATHVYLSFEILLEPMLICLLAGFLTVNYSPYRTELMKVLHDIGPYIYVAFFTLAGATLQLDVLIRCWEIALALFGIRMAAIFIGSFSGGMLAGDPAKYNKFAWMCYITQAGVGLGLAKQVSVEFPEWGATFATIIIAVIVLNQVVGPPLFKWALFLTKEAHPRAESRPSDGIRDAVIFGLDGESLALARLLQSNHWEVKIATTQVQYARQMADDSDIEIHSIPEVSIQTLNKLGVAHVDSIVAMLSDEENYEICDMIYENYGTRNLIVRLNHQAHFKRFHELGALVVEPSTAIVNLLDQFVRSPSAARLLLGLEKGRDIIEFELRNPDLQGIAIRELHLPLDLHILSIRRNGQLIVSVGFTQLQVGDWLTVVGSQASLEHMMLQFSEDREYAVVHMVDRATSKEIASQELVNEVEEIIHVKDDQRKEKFDRLIEEGIVLDLDQAMTYDVFFARVAEAMADSANILRENLFQLLMEREKELSTALRPDLAIPHIIIEGQNTFRILMARSKEGIYFSELAPKVSAVFVLVGTRDQRNFHLYALSVIAEAVQQIQFQECWRKAKNDTTLRNLSRTHIGI